VTADDFAFHRLVWFARNDKVDCFSLEERQEQFLRHWIVAVVLFEDLQVQLFRRIAQNHRVRLEMRRGVRKTDVVDARLEIKRHRVPDNGEVLVVNSERGFGSEA